MINAKIIIKMQKIILSISLKKEKKLQYLLTTYLHLTYRRRIQMMSMERTHLSPLIQAFKIVRNNEKVTSNKFNFSSFFFLLPYSSKDQPNQKRKMCVSSFWIFLIVIPKDQLMQQAYTLEQQMDTINIIFQVMIYIGLGISALLFFIYLKQKSYTMDAPI